MSSPPPSATKPPSDRIPPGILAARDYERLAGQFIPADRLAYIAGGSGEDWTAQANVAAFGRWSIVPRVLRDLRAGHTRVRIGTEDWAQPICLAPVAFQKLVHPRGELETARAAAATHTALLLSTLATTPLEDVAQLLPAQDALPRPWFQLYLQPRREDTLALVRRAEAAGYGAIVLTLDASIQLASHRALRAGFRMPADCVPAHGASAAMAPAVPEGASRIFQGAMALAPRAEDLAWLRTATPLPVWVKGVLDPADARALADAGCAGLVASNHGGRTVDGVAPSLSLLPAVREAVGPHVPLLFDGGIRSGADVFKALALGANAVLVGRLQLYALAAAGALGVAHLLRLLGEELQACMAVAGCARIADIGPDRLLAVPDFHAIP
ncbi:alpha-hydroxy acid oxidase [uncultured Pseudacidovorax sp.]|uniref:alpha-hydroxy acid oxidase n=1 Tax=uncultured Pseudacidovorax sp. TaxID=679313 RepID=UPI0025FA73F8|nr:alpha-hydroxy acid oxidase [uncultured Pseudacidovorax sp.]